MPKWDFRDVSIGIKKLREFLLGREYVVHHRFPPVIAPRSIPAPDVPRGPEYKYACQYYGNRNVLDSVKPPVVAPIAEGYKTGAWTSCRCTKTGQIQFPSELPIPGCVWWWDAHCYYKEVPNAEPCGPPPSDVPCIKLPSKFSEEPPPEAPLPKIDPCAEVKELKICAPCAPCKLEPCTVVKPEPPKLPKVEPCDPCEPPKKC